MQKKKRKGPLRVWRHLLVEITHCSVDALVRGFMSSLLKDFFFNDQTVIHFCFHRFESALFGHYRLSQETDDQTKVFAVVGKKKDEVRTSAGHAWIIETGGRRSDNGLVSQWWCCVRREPFFFFPSLLYLGKPDLKKIKIIFFGMHFLFLFLVR